MKSTNTDRAALMINRKISSDNTTMVNNNTAITPQNFKL